MDILLSIHPKWAKKIYNYEKTLEWRKNVPSDDFIDKIFLYETAPVKKITGYFVYDHYYSLVFKTGVPDPTAKVLIERGCVPLEELKKYAGQKDELFGWKVKNPQEFDTPRTLEDFDLKRPPQSWRYIDTKQ